MHFFNMTRLVIPLFTTAIVLPACSGSTFTGSSSSGSGKKSGTNHGSHTSGGKKDENSSNANGHKKKSDPSGKDGDETPTGKETEGGSLTITSAIKDVSQLEVCFYPLSAAAANPIESYSFLGTASGNCAKMPAVQVPMTSSGSADWRADVAMEPGEYWYSFHFFGKLGASSGGGYTGKFTVTGSAQALELKTCYSGLPCPEQGK